MKNSFEIRGETTILFINSPKYGTKEVPISTVDLPRVQQIAGCWSLSYDDTVNNFYVRSSPRISGMRFTLKLHRWIMKAPDNLQVDHIDRNPLNNVRTNLRLVTNRENSLNHGLYANNKTGIPGLKWHTRRKKYYVAFTIKGKTKHFGVFKDYNEAKKVALKVRKEII